MNEIKDEGVVRLTPEDGCQSVFQRRTSATYHNEQKDRPTPGTGYFSRKLVLRGLQDRNTTNRNTTSGAVQENRLLPGVQQPRPALGKRAGPRPGAGRP